MGEVVGVGLAVADAVGAGRQQSGHDMDVAVAEDLGIVDGLGDGAAEFGLAPRQAGQAALALVPVAGCGIEQHLAQAVVVQPGLQFGRRVGIGEQVLHALEAVRGGGGEAFEEVVAGVEHAEVGGEAGHLALLAVGECGRALHNGTRSRQPGVA